MEERSPLCRIPADSCRQCTSLGEGFSAPSAWAARGGLPAPKCSVEKGEEDAFTVEEADTLPGQPVSQVVKFNVSSDKSRRSQRPWSD